jgi:hypothetical protein
VENRSIHQVILGRPTLSSLVFEGWALLRFGFSLANLAKRRRAAALQKRAKRLTRLSFGLARRHRAALHDPFTLFGAHGYPH